MNRKNIGRNEHLISCNEIEAVSPGLLGQLVFKGYVSCGPPKVNLTPPGGVGVPKCLYMYHIYVYLPCVLCEQNKD